MLNDKTRDYYAGGLVFLLGIGTAVMGARYTVGTLTKMGPGFFPTALGYVMAFMGVMIAVANFMNRHAAAPAVDPHGGMKHFADWRGWGFIVASVLVFIFCASYLGLVPAIFLCVFVACWGDNNATLKGSAALSTGITIFGVFLFWYILRVQIPIIRGF
jgi:UPF0716 family protein affecting phage T7 exclusion